MVHFQLTRRSSVLLPFMLASAVLPSNAQTQPNPVPAAARVTNAAYDPNFYVGMWVTQDGYIRHELRPGGRYGVDPFSRTPYRSETRSPRCPIPKRHIQRNFANR